jgi:hypothetical protein
MAPEPSIQMVNSVFAFVSRYTSVRPWRDDPSTSCHATTVLAIS